jgi:hypothetical protein
MLLEPNSIDRQRDASTRSVGVNQASLRLAFGRGSLETQVAVTTPGLVAIGGLVSSILLSAAVIVLASTRKLPEGTLPDGMRRP